MRLTPAQKVEIIKKARLGVPVADICREAQISRTIFYKWFNKYNEVGSRAKGSVLANKTASGKNHWKGYTKQAERDIIKIALNNPDLSPKGLSRISNFSAHGIWNVLKRYGLNTREARLNYIYKYGASLVKPQTASNKVTMIRRFEAGEKLADLCREFNVSRTIFYSWLRKYKEAGEEQKLAVLENRRPSGESHWRSVPGARQMVISVIHQNPGLSSHKIAHEIASKAGRKVLGSHGVYNLLLREDLNTYEKRLRFAQGYSRVPEVQVAPLYIPQIPLYKLRHLIAHFATVPKLLLTQPKRGILLGLITYSPLIFLVFWLGFVLTSKASPIGLFFASIALFFGLFFFIYSMKYYISTLMVLRLAQSGAVQSESQKVESRLGKILSKMGLRLPQRQGVNPLNINLEKVELKEGERPFVSVHVAMYNEKRVVERLIRACEAQEWDSGDRQSEMVHREEKTPINNSNVILGSSAEQNDSRIKSLSDSGQARMTGQNPMNDTRLTINNGPANYEVIIADDSTDETTAMAKEILSTNGRILDRILFNEEMEIYVSSPPVGSPLPVIKLIHRFSRSGFKGGALQKALENTNPKAAYITIFDADFVPYPDTLTQFVKTFQVLGRSTKSTTSITSTTSNEKTFDTSDTFGTSDTSNIAAVQGYQWHVLNKSQNWVTRGVRTEYAGSYVIERAGEEIYGGLKQIAGSVYMIRADILRQFGWGKSITEDFELTLRLYERGYKVAFTPYIQAPAEAVSTLKRLIRQRMRWAEGASFNIKVMLGRMLWGRWETARNNVILGSSAEQNDSRIKSLADSGQARMTGESQDDNANYDPGSTLSTLSDTGSAGGKVWVPSKLTRAEKLEFAYLAPYYLQAAFFVVGTFSWFISETIIGTRLPFWTAALGWSLVFTNLLALPLMNIVGMFLEESDERDYIGILSFIALSYIVVPFQAYAAIKGFLEREEGPWFRTPKTGLITDTLGRSGFSKFFGNILGRPAGAPISADVGRLVPIDSYSSNEVRSFLKELDNNLRGKFSLRSNNNGLALAKLGAFNPVKPRYIRHMGNLALGTVIALTVLMSMFAPFVPAATSYASQTQLRTVESNPSTDSGQAGQLTGSTSDQPASPAKRGEQPATPPKARLASGGSNQFDPKDPPNKEEIMRNVMTEEITKSRAIKKTTKGGKSVEFMFEKEPRARIKLDSKYQIEFETKAIFGQRVNPQKAKIYSDKEVVYEEVIPNVDLKYSLTNDLLVEEVILKSTTSIKSITGTTGSEDANIEQDIKTVDVKVVSPDPGSFGFYSDDGQELFQLSQPFAKDAKGEVNNDLRFMIYDEFDGHRLVKSLGDSVKSWLSDPNRAYPVSIDPTVIVSGGIAETETTYGGLQRKVAFVNSNWYAFYGTSANDCVTTCSVNYKRSTDGVTWGSAVDMDSSDTDNYNPSISVSGNIIFVFWIDVSTTDLEGRRLDTGSSDALDTLCTTTTAVNGDASYMVTVAAYSTTGAIVASSDTDAGSGINLFDMTDMDTCSNQTNIQTGNIVFGSGLTAGDRPVIVYGANLVASANQTNLDGVAMIFQDGDLSYSLYNEPGQASNGGGKWISNNLQIANVTDNIYSVTTDGTTVWILSVSGTTATNFYSCCTSDIVETQVDADAGTTNDDGDSDIDMFCPAENNCKIVYTDDIDTTSPALKFVDCNDSNCSSPTITTLIADLGDATDQAGASIYCVDDGDAVVSDNCKVVTADLLGSNSTDVSFIDCTNDEDCSTNTLTDVVGDIATGNDTVMFHSSIYCPSDGNCKFVFTDELGGGSGLPNVSFVDCGNATCASGNVITDLDSDWGTNNLATPTAPWVDLYCVASDDCKIVYHDNSATGGCADANSLCFIDCTADEDCSTNTQTVIDSDAGTTQGATPVAVDCVGGTTECTIVYGDSTDADLTFVDCEGSATCASGSTITDIDTTGGANTETFVKVSLYCVSNSDCKIFYSDRAQGDGAFFADCDNETCTTGSIYDFPGLPRWGGALVCLTSANCKFAYYKGTDSAAPTVQFTDCDVTNCFPSQGVNAGAAQLLDGDTLCVLTSCSTSVDVGVYASIYCPTAADCKIAYADNGTGDLKFADCDTATCATGTVSILDGASGCVLTGCSTTASVGSFSSIYCPTATDCKIAYYDATNTALKFADCDAATCSSGTATFVDGEASCVVIGCNTLGSVGQYASIDCSPGATDCKISYYNSTGGLKFADCGAATCSSGNIGTPDGGGACQLTNCSNSADVGKYSSIYCISSTDCKISYYDLTNSALKFADCDSTACSSGTANILDGNTSCLLTSCSTTASVGAPSAIACPSATDCKISYGSNNNLYFADCDTATCSTGNVTLLEGASGCVLTNCSTTIQLQDNATTSILDMMCLSATDCKISYLDNTNTALKFADCDTATCSTGTVTNLDGISGCVLMGCLTGNNDGLFASIYCLTEADCKIAYYDSTFSALRFADCDTATCANITSFTAPWSGQTAVETVSLTYDSTNSDLYAHIIMDTSDQAYWKSSDATTISWGSQSSYSFTAGTLNQISAPQSGAGTSQIGVVLNQGSNFEFSAIPERTIYLLLAAPFLYIRLRKHRRL